MRALLVLTIADLRQRVRDRTVLIFGVLVPLGLITVFNLVFGGTSDIELKPVTVAASVVSGDQYATIVLDTLRSNGAVDATVRSSTPAGVRRATETGKAELGIVVPAGFTDDVQAGRPTSVRLIEGEGSGLETDILASVVDGTVDQLYAATVAVRAGAGAGVPPAQLGELGRHAATDGSLTLSKGTSANEQLSPAAALVAGQTGLFLLFTVGFGVLALLAEREQGTLARLQSMPLPRGLIVASKALSGYVLGVFATTVLLLAGGWLFDVSFGDPFAVGALVLAATAAAISLTFVVARVARTAEQANAAQTIIAMVLGLAGGAFLPIQVDGLAGRLLELNPVAALQRGLGITSGGGGLGDIGAPVLVLLGFGVVGVLLARALPDRGARA